MKRYKHSKKSTERVGFYVALSVCMMAVGLAIWSAYASFSDEPADNDGYFSSLSSMTTADVAQPMTGITEVSTSGPTSAPTVPATTAPTVAPTDASAQPETRTKRIALYETATLTYTDDVMADGELSSLQAVLRVADSLIYPVKSRSVLKQYSEDAVYSQTMKDYRSHPGCDFVAEEGESVYAMCGGTVKNISVSELYGVIIEIESDGFSIYYCGLSSDLMVDKGDLVTTGDTVGTVAKVPCESADDSHIHIEVRVGNKLIDPLSVIDSDS